MPAASRSKTAPARTMTGFRCSVDQLAEIDKNATAHGLSRTEYIIKAALGELDGSNTRDQRIDELEKRMASLESKLDRLAELAY